MTSKRRSGSKKPPEPPTFFLDECIDCESIASALQGAGARVERYRDHFPPRTEDVDWLGPVSDRGWLVLTADKSQRRKPLELQALVEAEARQFVIRGRLTGEEMASRVVKHLKRMTNIAGGEAAPFVAHITKERVTVVERRRSLRQRSGALAQK